MNSNSKQKRQNTLVAVALLLLLVTLTVGVTYAFFNYAGQGTKENTITTGSLTFVYNEKGTGITLTNQFPMTDTNGKALAEAGNVFNFQVTGNATGGDIQWEVNATKVSGTLPDNMVKVYLTTVADGGSGAETPTPLAQNAGTVKTFDQYTNSTVSGQEANKVLYQSTVNDGGSVDENFRLRMWLSDQATGQTGGNWNYNNQNFTVKINVVANGI